jgi:hypothetical protein
MTTTSTGAAPATVAMTIGELARRSGMSVKALRRLEGKSRSRVRGAGTNA